MQVFTMLLPRPSIPLWFRPHTFLRVNLQSFSPTSCARHKPRVDTHLDGPIPSSGHGRCVRPVSSRCYNPHPTLEGAISHSAYSKRQAKGQSFYLAGQPLRDRQQRPGRLRQIQNQDYVLLTQFGALQCNTDNNITYIYMYYMCINMPYSCSRTVLFNALIDQLYTYFQVKGTCIEFHFIFASTCECVCVCV